MAESRFVRSRAPVEVPFEAEVIEPEPKYLQRDAPILMPLAVAPPTYGWAAPPRSSGPFSTPLTADMTKNYPRLLLILGGVFLSLLMMVAVITTIATGSPRQGMQNVTFSFVPVAACFATGLIGLSGGLYEWPIIFKSPFKRFQIASWFGDAFYKRYIIFLASGMIGLAYCFLLGLILAPLIQATKPVGVPLAAAPNSRTKSWQMIAHGTLSKIQSQGIDSWERIIQHDSSEPKHRAHMEVFDEAEPFFQALVDSRVAYPPWELMEPELQRQQALRDAALERSKTELDHIAVAKAEGEAEARAKVCDYLESLMQDWSHDWPRR